MMAVFPAVILLSFLALAIADPIPSVNNVSPIYLRSPPRPEDIPPGNSPYETNAPVNMEKLARYSPAMSNQYHLFTRRNPAVSQPLLLFNNGVLQNSNFDKSRRVVILVHGYDGNSTSEFVRTMVPAILAASDLNLIVIDWTEGTEYGLQGVILSANSAANFVLWLMEQVEDSFPEDYHIIGLGVGGHYASILSRSAGQLGHVTALDPPIWRDTNEGIRPYDAEFVEVDFTNSDGVINPGPYGRVDFYPNGGRNMPGCGGDWACNHARSYFYMAESLMSGGFTGTECESMENALVGNCNLPGRLRMGAPVGTSIPLSIYHLETNAAPPFSKG